MLCVAASQENAIAQLRRPQDLLLSDLAGLGIASIRSDTIPYWSATWLDL